MTTPPETGQAPEGWTEANRRGEGGEANRRDLAARLILLSLERSSPRRVRWLLGDSDPATVVDQLANNVILAPTTPAPRGTRELVSRWVAQASAFDGDAMIERELEARSSFLTPDDPLWPFDDDPDPPLIVFYRGHPELLAAPASVAVVGTRRCTSVGRRVAYGLGHDLAWAGVPVVSGLALGVDGSAHRGALDVGGAVIGVVGSGIDTVYPKKNRPLWNEVGRDGLLMTEYMAGTTPERWRFPARNRLISALSVGVVVVESHQRGGSLSTADEAADRGKPVFAVPGSVLSPAAEGTNALLADGAIPVRAAADVVAYLGLVVPETEHEVAGAGWVPEQLRLATDEVPAAFVDLVAEETALGPVHLDTLVLRSGLGIDEVVAATQRMATQGLVDLEGSTVSLPSVS